MALPQIIGGTCSCGRNHYLIHLPPNHHTSTELRFDDDHTSTPASPLAAYIRIPLSWLRSTTLGLLPHESAHDICRVFVPAHEPAVAQRKFCGFCGAALTRWSEVPRSEAAWIGVSVGILDGAAVRVLSASGVLPGREKREEDDEDEEDDDIDDDAREEEEEEREGGEKDGDGDEGKQGEEGATATVAETGRAKSKATRRRVWYESMIEGSALGRMRRRWGEHTADGGRTKVEWEIVEVESEGHSTAAGSTSAKRKLEEGGTGRDPEVEEMMQTD